MGSLPTESTYSAEPDIIDRTRDPSGILYGPEKAARARQNPIPIYACYGQCQVRDVLKGWQMKSFSNKDEARRYARDIWSGLNAERRQGLEEKAIQRIRHYLDRGCSRIFLTAPFGDELRLLSHVEALGCDLFLPVIREERMEFMAYRVGGRTAELKPGRFGIAEPQSSSVAVPDQESLMLVPALACNLRRFRLGRGGGFFDRYFSFYSARCRKVSVLPVELVEIDFPEQSHDIKLDELVTDTGTVE